MFGTVKPYVPDLRVREHEYYRALYCGLCREMRRATGFFSSASLSYDMVFLLLTKLLYCEEFPKLVRRRCFLHPFRKHAEVTSSPDVNMTARLSAVLVAGKLRDDIKDERGLRRLVAKMKYRFFRRSEKKAGLSETSAHIQALLCALSALERDKTPSVDRPAALFGELLRAVFAEGVTDEGAKKEMGLVGDLLGRVIYKTDAFLDYEEDCRRDRYNPYRCLYGDRKMTEEERASAKAAIRIELMSLEEAILALPLSRDAMIAAIIQNILYLGLPEALETKGQQHGSV